MNTTARTTAKNITRHFVFEADGAYLRFEDEQEFTPGQKKDFGALLTTIEWDLTDKGFFLKI